MTYIETQPQISPRLARWLENLLEFEFTIEYIKGKSNKVSDALSRIDGPEKQEDQVQQQRRRLSDKLSARLKANPKQVSFDLPQERHPAVGPESDQPSFRLQTATLVLENMHPDDKQDLLDSYANDPFFKNIVNAESLSDGFIRNDGLLFYQSKLCVPESSYHAKLLYDNHSIPVSGHLGIRKTASRLTPSYLWPKMRDTIRKYVQSCQKCQ